MKEILIINGSGGVGKDTFVDKLSRYAKVIQTSIVNPVKDLAKKINSKYLTVLAIYNAIYLLC